jgi:hypothetical protein
MEVPPSPHVVIIQFLSAHAKTFCASGKQPVLPAPPLEQGRIQTSCGAIVKYLQIV